MNTKYLVEKGTIVNRLLAGCPKELAELNFEKYPPLRYFAIVRQYLNSSMDFLLENEVLIEILENPVENWDEVFIVTLKEILTEIFTKTQVKSDENDKITSEEVEYLLKLFKAIADLESSSFVKGNSSWVMWTKEN